LEFDSISNVTIPKLLDDWHIVLFPPSSGSQFIPKQYGAEKKEN